MIQQRLSFILKFMCLCTCLALPMTVSAGEISRADKTKDFKWKSTECPLPIPPAAFSKESAEDRLMVYAKDVSIYIDCIQQEAQRDFEKAQMDLQTAIERDLEKQTNIMNGMMLQAAKTMR